jgi:hypothetical protein
MPRLNIPSTLIAMTVLLSTISAQAQKNPPPQPFSKYLVYTAAGVYDPNIPPPQGNLAEWYQQVVMRWTPAEVAAKQAEADQYFLSTFGIPLGSSVAFGVDPRNEYRAYFISDENVPPEGWVVRDGGFMVTTGDDGSGGMILHGTWGGPAGRWVPEGTFAVFGFYNIAVTGPGRGRGKDDTDEDTPVRAPIIIHYQSAEPIIPNPHQAGVLFQCRLISSDFGMGLAQGISIPHKTADGKTIADIRNILTFPGLGFAAQ